MDPEFMPLSSEGELITKHERDQAVCVASRSQRLTLATKNYCKEGRRAKEIVIRTTKKKKSGFENRQVLLLLKKKRKEERQVLTVIASSHCSHFLTVHLVEKRPQYLRPKSFRTVTV